MRFLTTFRADSITDTRVDAIRCVIEQKMNALISEKDYGAGITVWHHVIFSYVLELHATKLPKIGERFTHRETKVETCREIDSEQLLKADEKEVFRLICESILVSMYDLKLKEFDYRAFRDDVIALFRHEGWVSTTFFMTGETDAAIGDDKIRFNRDSIPDKIKSWVSTTNYGAGIDFWGHIIICCEPEMYAAGFFPEIKKYTKKDRTVELRLRIDYDAMLNADEHGASKLICESILRGVDIVEHELKVKDFNFDAFRADLISLFKKEGWL